MEQDVAVRDFDAVVNGAIAAYMAGDREPHRLFTREVVIGENGECIVNMLRHLQNSVVLIVHGNDFAIADAAYQGGSRLAIEMLNLKWSALIRQEISDLVDSALWQGQQNRVEQANNDVATAMSTGGELVDF